MSKLEVGEICYLVKDMKYLVMASSDMLTDKDDIELLIKLNNKKNILEFLNKYRLVKIEDIIGDEAGYYDINEKISSYDEFYGQDSWRFFLSEYIKKENIDEWIDELLNKSKIHNREFMGYVQKQQDIYKLFSDYVSEGKDD